MKLEISITPEIRTIDGIRKYYYGNVEFDTPEAFDVYVRGLDLTPEDLNPSQTIQDICSTFDPKIHTAEIIAELINQQKTNEIQKLS